MSVFVLLQLHISNTMNIVCVQARALQALESQSELMFALCRRDYTKLKRRFDARAHGREQAIEAREKAAMASKLQAMWRGRSVRSAHKTQREATCVPLRTIIAVYTDGYAVAIVEIIRLLICTRLPIMIACSLFVLRSLLLEIQMLDQGEDIPSAERALPTPLGAAGEPQPTVATAKETPQQSEGSDATGVGALLEEWLLPERELPRPT